MPDPGAFTVGGTVQAHGGLYLSRSADEDLLHLCRNGIFAYVLYARQVGKSSLMLSTAQRLREFGIRSVFIDLTRIGTRVTAEQWYLGQLIEVAEQLELETDPFEWWVTRRSVGEPQRMINFFREVLLSEIKERVIIFIDEIDTTLALPFADDYFAAIRAIYNARHALPDFNRLSFVLTGVATPSELISDPRRTPFNIGETINLADFTLEEATPLAEKLSLPQENSHQVLAWVLKWTGGHPYLTLRVCRAILEEPRHSWLEKDVDSLVRKLFLEMDILQDSNLLFVRGMLTNRLPPGLATGEVLLTYRDIRRGRPVADDRSSLIKSHLKLCGLVKSQGGSLCIRNRIYREVFDERWIDEHLPLRNRFRLILRRRFRKR